MGMYDDVVCNFPLNDDHLPAEGWQTKSMDCCLAKYTIHADGTLTMRPFNDPDFPTDDEDVRENYTGEIQFYQSVDENYRDPDSWWEFRARFDHGELVRLTRLRPNHEELHINEFSSALQRAALKDNMNHILKRDAMAVKWHVWGDHTATNRKMYTTYIEVRDGVNGRKFTVTQMGEVLNKDGEWEHEPLPSSRDDDFIARTRFDSFDEAYNHAKEVRARRLLGP